VALFTLEFPPAYSGALGVHVGGLLEYLRSQGDAFDVFYLGPRPAPPGTILLPVFETRLPTGVIDASLTELPLALIAPSPIHELAIQ
jgi:hypothetical protein